jgi:type I restriction enzyme, S subunit
MSFPRYPAYKPSGVEWLGEVPEHWDVTALKHGYVVTLGKMLQPEALSEGDMLLPYLRAANIRWSGVDGSDIKTMWFSARDRDHLRLKFGDLLVSEGGDVGRSALWKGEVDECYFQNSVNRVRPSNGNLTSFLRYWMSTMKDKGFIDVLCNKSTIAHFTAEKVGAVPVPLPPVDEQHAILSFLDHETAKLDALIAEQQRLIELLQEKRQAVISHAVTKGLNPDVPMKDSGVEWLGEVPEHWSLVRLKHAAKDKVAGPYGASLTKSMYTHAGYRVYGQQQVIPDNFEKGDYYIDSDKYEEMNRYSVSPGDILISVMGTVGKVAVVPDGVEPGIINPRLVRYHLRDLLIPRFAQRLLLSTPFQEKILLEAKGATMDGLNMQILGDLALPVPPRAEQEAILDQLLRSTASFDAMASSTEHSILLLKERRSALISAAVTGQIDVRGLVPEAEAA